MARPSKGDRVAISLRIPRPLSDRMTAARLGDRNEFIVVAIAEKLLREAP